ncbi:MAG: hypothetical protein ACLVD8_26745 [Enterocloster sp.]
MPLKQLSSGHQLLSPRTTSSLTALSAENIRLGKPDASDEEVLAAAQGGP